MATTYRTAAVAKGPFGRLGNSQIRIRAFMVAMGVLISVAAGETVLIQGIDSDGYAQAAAAQMASGTRELAAMRGKITDRNGVVLAQTLSAVKLVADPYGIALQGVLNRELTAKEKEKAAQAPQAIAEILVKHLGGAVSDYLPHLTMVTRDNGSRNQYQVIAYNVPSYTYQRIKADLSAGDWYGISSEDTPIRAYPDGALAANVVGFTGGDLGEGLAGIEQSQQYRLEGVPGKESYESSTYGRIPLGDSMLIPAVDGEDIALTIDAELQYAANQELAAAMASSGATTGTAIVMNVKTGEVLAMANAPTFDSNTFATSSPEDLGNRAVMATYEPGSVQKVVTMAALADAGLITGDTLIQLTASDSKHGLESGEDLITDSWDHGVITLSARGVLAYSSNIGTALLARQLDKATLLDYYRSFGLGSPTGIELPGEGNSTLGHVPDNDVAIYDRDRMTFGQAISVTALQEAAAIAGIVNGGVYVAPTIIVDDEPQEARRIISAEASSIVLDMMEAVVASPQYIGTRGIPGYRVAGKSGTAQRVDPRTGTYSGYTASFIMVAPVEDPQILVYVVLDNPTQGSHEGGVVALPATKGIMTYALGRYGIPARNDIPAYTGRLV
jgi:cell division protein FtsI (penicillin-binding protein 3)